ncbi:hypothetical protein [Yersinia intermedia]|uniref:hypothetical protein n=1 Tax=Yersinia intermedia TaxID=631 RepID=UPI000B41AECD|nr:hypothetical protein [Yersinia intermedia]OVZ72835.1 hypothetical protein CBW55_23245 [Yersinia intermedia]
MKALDSFTVERLEELIKSASLEPCDAEPIYDNVQVREIAALARIALTVKRAEPVAWEVKGILCHSKEEADSYVGEPVPLYEAPQLNSPEIPDGWTSSDPANAALVMLDRIDTIDSADDDRIEDIKLIIRQLASAPEKPL